MHRLPVPGYVLYICSTLRDAGHKAYVVGGGVRDALLGRIPKDWDVATDALPERVQQLFPRTVATGIRFGTVSVLVDESHDAPSFEDRRRGRMKRSAVTEGHEKRSAASTGESSCSTHDDLAKVRAVEVTTFRGESGYTDGRHPEEVDFIGNIEDDLVRRDFTVNAIAYDPFLQRVVDPYGGRADLRQRLIRAVGDPDRRLKEDGLRVLRAIRLATELGFSIESDTAVALQGNGPVLRQISRERIGQEWLRIITAPAAGRGLKLLEQFHLLRFVFTVDSADAGEDTRPYALAPASIARIAAALDRLRGTPEATEVDQLVVRTAIILYVLDEPAYQRRWLRALHYPARVIRATLLVTEGLAELSPRPLVTDGDLRRLLHRIGRANIDAFCSAWRALHPGADAERIRRRIARIVAAGDALDTNELAVDGRDVLQTLHLPPGPEVGELLERLLQHVFDHPGHNSRDCLLQLLREWASSTESTER